MFKENTAKHLLTKEWYNQNTKKFLQLSLKIQIIPLGPNSFYSRPLCTLSCYFCWGYGPPLDSPLRQDLRLFQARSLSLLWPHLADKKQTFLAL